MTLPIILATDDRFAMACGVTIESVLQTARSPLRFELFESGVSSENLERLKQVVAAHPGHEIEFINADEVLRPLPMPARSDDYSRMIYARLFAPELLGYSRALYLDTDTLVKEDVTALFHWDLGDRPLGVVRDYGTECRSARDPKIRAHFQQLLGRLPIGGYFNTGVLVMDFDAFRKQRLGEQAIQFIQDHPELHFPDQDALNVVMNGNVTYLPERWNTMVMERRVCFDPFVPKDTQARVRAAFDDPAIIHYAGTKPWSPFPVYWRKDFWRVLQQTPWHRFQITTRGMDWSQKRKVVREWRAQLVRLRIRRQEFLLQLFGRPLVHMRWPL